MTVQELVEQTERLSLEDRLILLEALSRSIRQSLQTADVKNVRGLLATDQPAPSDEEVEQTYIDYIDEKYR